MLRRRTDRLRLVAGLSALLALLASLGGVAHLTAVRHVACLEHGELIHVAEAAKVSSAARATAALDAAAAEHQHEHCAIMLLRRQSATPQQRDLTTATPLHRDAAPLIAATEAPPPALARYLVAPKNSPPRG